MRKLIAESKTYPTRFLRQEKGSATIEAVLWLPIFMVVFALMVDASMVFNGQSKVLRVVQDANRNMSIGRFTTNSEVETYVNTELAKFGVVPSQTTAVSDTSVVLTAVSIPIGQLQTLGLFSALMNLEVDVTAGHILDSADASSFTTTVVTSTL